MGTRPRLPTNVIWSLEDAQGGVLGMWHWLREASKRAVKAEDAVMLGLLNEAMGELATVERHVRNARAGVYVGACGDEVDRVEVVDRAGKNGLGAPPEQWRDGKERRPNTK